MELTAARLLAATLIEQHNVLYSFGWCNHVKAAGICDYQNRTIWLSRPVTLLNTEEMVRNTILHEIAHALTPGDGHGHQWKAACVRIGANPSRLLYEDGVKVIAPPPKFQLFAECCGTSGKVWYKKPRRLDYSGAYCVKCGPVSTGQIFIYSLNEKREKIKKVLY